MIYQREGQAYVLKLESGLLLALREVGLLISVWDDGWEVLGHGAPDPLVDVLEAMSQSPPSSYLEWLYPGLSVLAVKADNWDVDVLNGIVAGAVDPRPVLTELGVPAYVRTPMRN